MRRIFFLLPIIVLTLVPLSGEAEQDYSFPVTVTADCNLVNCVNPTGGTVGAGPGGLGGGDETITVDGEDGVIPAEMAEGNGELGGDAFDRLPFAKDVSSAQNLTLESFSFIQIGENLTPLNNVVRINGSKHLTISLPYRLVPTVLKTIGVTLFAPDDHTKALSFILRSDDERETYSATLAPLGHSGIYPVAIHVIDFKNERLKKITGDFQVSGVGFIPSKAMAAVFNDIIRPLVITSGILAGATQLVAVSTVASAYDIWLLIIRGISALFAPASTRRKRKPWGTVYDSITKRPIDPAYITVYQNGKMVTSAITDIDGRYGFTLPTGIYQLVAQKTHYQFPSRLLEGKTEDELYPNLYFGEPITARGGEVVAYNIPMDPVGFDWNEFAKAGEKSYKRSLEKEIWRGHLYNVISTLGLILAVGSVIVLPSILNFFVLLVYAGLDTLSRRSVTRYKLLTIRRQITGEPIPFAVVRVFLAGIKKEVKAIVADRYGRIYFLVRPGSYYLTIDRKMPDGSYYTFHKTEVRDLPKGVWPHDIVVAQYKEEA